ncbi:hypothetical protein GOD71_27305 [Sinorhizobium medicae]|uniref:hypothetical protein n=1 Tax=Rhizobium meliloti TaxID=382 RepID=UPI001295CF80|nr:hypothetical protein [Sinorhizobium meliloti]MDX0741205.1 hypothetical protein [Sinorhizobium medicae]MQX67479.1 hypothetical protein [Sinorhizobium meliloti]
MYIPPFIVPPEKVEEYNKLEVQSGQALRQLDVVAYEELQSAQKASGFGGHE